MPPETVSVQLKLSGADARALKRDYFKRRWSEWLIAFGPAVLLLFYLAFVPRLACFMHSKGFNYTLAEDSCLLIGIASFVAIQVIVSRMLGESRRRRNISYQGYKLIISSDGVQMERDGLKSNAEWRIVHAVRHAGQHTFFYLDDQQAYIFPRRAFESDADFANFRDIANRYFAMSRSAVG